MTSVRDQILVKVTDTIASTCCKITIVGTGQVGMACAVAILAQNVSNELCLIDSNLNKAQGELMDLQHGSWFLQDPKITASSDYAAAANSHVCIVAAGVRQKEDESQLAMVQRNTNVIKDIIPKLVKHCPNAIFVILSRPVDIMTFIAWKLSGLAKNRVIGSGTGLDSSCFKFLLSERLGVAPTSCHGWVIGEHGENSIPLWSGVNVAGMRLRELNSSIGIAEDPEKWNDIHKQIIKTADEVVKIKGYIGWSYGLWVAHLVSAILRNTNCLMIVSTNVRGFHDIDKDVFLSLPCVMNANGVTSIVKQLLTPSEVEQLHKSASILSDIQAEIKF